MTFFSTERLPLAIYIHATGKLGFLGCKLLRPGALQFTFEDPDHVGKDVELAFDRGAEVPATSLFASQKFLRRSMTEALEKRNNGKSYDYTNA